MKRDMSERTADKRRGKGAGESLYALETCAVIVNDCLIYMSDLWHYLLNRKAAPLSQ